MVDRPITIRPLLVIALVSLTCAMTSCSRLVNLCGPQQGATVTGPKNASGSRGQPSCVIDEQVSDYGRHHGYGYAYLDTPTIVQLRQPAPINAVEVIFLDIGPRAWTYTVSVSQDGEEWTQVAQQTELICGWRLHRFEEETAQYIRLDVTGATGGLNSYQLIELAAWDLPQNVSLTPISRAWEAAKARAIERDVAMLEADVAQELLNDPAEFSRAKKLKDGEHFHTTLSDGTNALVFRDGDAFVVAIDDNGDMTPDDTAPDMVEDCLAVDLGRDGVLDRVFDYNDDDGDGVAETMVQKYIHFSNWGQMPFMVLVRDFDQGPLRFWHLQDYTYWQRPCQWQCDFAGDGYFAMFERENGRWTPSRENPFCFYSTDDDPLPEETVRIVCNGDRIHSARYSINADNDSWEPELYDYDVGITCLGEQTLPEDAATTFTTRGGEETAPFLAWEHTRQTVRSLPWERCLFIWDENDSNTARRAPEHERWEGILNSRYRDFPQEGGPPSGRINDRFELDRDFSGAMQLYYWPADGRLHLLGAEVGTLQVDWDYDDGTDMTIEYADTDDDGLFDERRIEYADAGLKDRRIGGPRNYQPVNADENLQPLAYSYEAVHPFWSEKLKQRDTAGRTLLAALRSFADRAGVELAEGPMEFFQTAGPDECFEIEKLRASRESERYYCDLAIELALAQLMAEVDGKLHRPLRRARGWWDRGELQRATEELTGAPAE